MEAIASFFEDGKSKIYLTIREGNQFLTDFVL